LSIHYPAVKRPKGLLGGPFFPNLPSLRRSSGFMAAMIDYRSTEQSEF